MPVRRRRPAHAPAVLAVAGLLGAMGGCGSDDSTDDQQVRATVAAFAKGTADKDYEALCTKVLSSRLVVKVEAIGLGCERALEQSLGTVDAPTLRLLAVRIRKDVALAQISTAAVGEQASTDTLRLVKEKQGWRIASLSGAQPPAPPPAPAEAE